MTGTNAEICRFIRTAKADDLPRIAEILIFNYRLNFYPIFKSDWFYFQHLQVPNLIKQYEQHKDTLTNTFVYDDGVVKGFIQLNGAEVEKLFVEPVLQKQGIGAKLLNFAIAERDVRFLWALERIRERLLFISGTGFA